MDIGLPYIIKYNNTHQMISLESYVKIVYLCTNCLFIIPS